jgi:hypothetical protein
VPRKLSERLRQGLRGNVSGERRRGNGLSCGRGGVNEYHRYANGKRTEHPGHHARDLRRWLTQTTPRALPFSLRALAESVLPGKLPLILGHADPRRGHLDVHPLQGA